MLNLFPNKRIFLFSCETKEISRNLLFSILAATLPKIIYNSIFMIITYSAYILLDHTVDAREIKARLELPIIRYMLSIGAELINSFNVNLRGWNTANAHFFDAFTVEDKSRCVRIALECSLFLQLRLYGTSYFLIHIRSLPFA